jgi:hypothetical protein
VSTPEDRAARIADVRTLLDTLEADESLPLPGELTHLGFMFRAGRGVADAQETRRQLAALESAIPAEFSGHSDGTGDWAVEGVMPGGVKVQILAYARYVTREVTTVRETEVTELVRLPVQDETTEDGAQA